MRGAHPAPFALRDVPADEVAMVAQRRARYELDAAVRASLREGNTPTIIRAVVAAALDTAVAVVNDGPTTTDRPKGDA